MNTAKKTLLFDMDSTAYDFLWPIEEGILAIRDTLDYKSELHFVPKEERTRYDISVLFTQDISLQRRFEDDIRAIYHNQDFFKDLQLFPGAKEVITEFSDYYYIQFCSTPSCKNVGSELGKRHALERDFGARVAREVIFAYDKTCVRWHILVDDRADVHKGMYLPEREHIVFDQPYNREEHEHIIWKRRVNWDTIRDVLLITNH